MDRFSANLRTMWRHHGYRNRKYLRFSSKMSFSDFESHFVCTSPIFKIFPGIWLSLFIQFLLDFGRFLRRVSLDFDWLMNRLNPVPNIGAAVVQSFYQRNKWHFYWFLIRGFLFFLLKVAKGKKQVTDPKMFQPQDF